MCVCVSVCLCVVGWNVDGLYNEGSLAWRRWQRLNLIEFCQPSNQAGKRADKNNATLTEATNNQSQNPSLIYHVSIHPIRCLLPLSISTQPETDLNRRD